MTVHSVQKVSSTNRSHSFAQRQPIGSRRINALVCLVFAFILAFASNQNAVTAQDAGAWSLPKDAMLTRWGKRLTPNNAWQEYPRPQFVRENKWRCLNGLWDYAVTKGQRPKSYTGKILVPFAIESSLSGVRRLLDPSESLWYRTTLKHRTPDGHRTYLRFEGRRLRNIRLDRRKQSRRTCWQQRPLFV